MKNCKMVDCKHYNSLNFQHNNMAIAHTQIAPPSCENCRRFHDDNYVPRLTTSKGHALTKED